MELFLKNLKSDEFDELARYLNTVKLNYSLLPSKEVWEGVALS